MFDRTTWIAIALSIAGLVGWQFYYSKTYAPYIAQQATLQREAKLKSQVAKASEPVAQPIAPTVTPTAVLLPAVAGATPQIPELSAKRETLDTSRAEYLFAANTGGIEAVTLFLHLGANEHSLFLNKDSGLPIGALCDSNGTPIGGFSMETDKKQAITRFTLATPGGLSVTKSFTLPQTVGAPEEYQIGLDLSFKNSGSTPITLPGYFVAAGGEAPIHIKDLPTYTCFDWLRDGKMTSIDVNWFEAGKIPLVGIETRPARPLYTQQDSGIQWAAVTSQYFCTIVSAAKDQAGSGVWARRFQAQNATETPNGQPIYGITGGLGTGPIALAPGETITRHYSIYAGPK
ncbi:MAG: membrane protein insertase YidC, partial [Verrucomicrobiota bacterium]